MDQPSMTSPPTNLLLPAQVDDLGLALITLARELWVTRDRQVVLEHILEKNGLIGDIAAYQPDEALTAKLTEERTRFIQSLNATLLRSAQT